MTRLERAYANYGTIDMSRDSARVRFYGGSMDGQSQEIRYAYAKYVCVPAVVDGKHVIERYKRDRTRHARDEHGALTEIALVLDSVEEWVPPPEADND